MFSAFSSRRENFECVSAAVVYKP